MNNEDISRLTHIANEHHNEQRLNHEKLVIYDSSKKLAQPAKLQKNGLSAKKVVAVILVGAAIVASAVAINKMNEADCERLGLEPGTVISVDGDGGGATGDYYDESKIK